MSSDNGKSGSALLEEGLEALHRGDSEDAFELLDRARQVGVAPEQVVRLASGLGLAARFVSRHAYVLAWIEQALAAATRPEDQARFMSARIAVCRQVDVKRVLELAEEALRKADEVDDEESYAAVLSHASFAAYRAGDGRTATRFADHAEARRFSGKSAQYDATRARMFAATARGEHELSLKLSCEARDLALEIDRRADAANESNNIAEVLLDLGRPEEARDEATVAAELALESGHRQVEAFARVLMAIATAEVGNVDPALVMLARVHGKSVNTIFAMDAASAEAYWLLERGAAGDSARAREVALSAIRDSGATGVNNRLTLLWSQVARSYAREGAAESARDAIGKARGHLDKSEPQAELQLALAFTEVFPVGDPQRRTALTNARNRILRGAAKRHDPRAFCLNVRLHRRLLELSGGVPTDMLG